MRIADPNALVDSARRIFIMKQFNNAASHLLVSTLTPGVESIEALSSYNLQKLLLRELRMWKAAPEDGQLLWNKIKGRWHPGLQQAKSKQQAAAAAAAVTSQEEDNDNESSESDADGRAASRPAPGSQPRSTMPMEPIKRPTKPSPVLFTYYGALMMVAKSYQSAMCASAAVCPSSIRQGPYKLTMASARRRLLVARPHHRPVGSAHLLPARALLPRPSIPAPVRQSQPLHCPGAYNLGVADLTTSADALFSSVLPCRRWSPSSTSTGPTTCSGPTATRSTTISAPCSTGSVRSVSCFPSVVNRLTAASLPGLFHLAKGHFNKILARAETDGRTGSEVSTLICLRRTAASSADPESLLITARVAHPRDGLQPEPHPQHDAGAV
jgi:hypothetical protein